ncbi:penicillin-binding transpeptidase domain-containing protein, partial [Mycolicibacter sinensis]
AATVRNMLRAVTQRDPTGVQQGTGWQAAVDGYQIAGKTGTAQQINSACGCYYDDVYWITFAGIAPADNPRYVIGLMMDNPHRAADGSPGTSGAPLFHNIAAWLLQRHNVPLSPDPGPPLVLQAM